MADGNFSPADLAAVTGNGGFGGNDGLGWLILIFLMLGWGGYGNRGGVPMPEYEAFDDQIPMNHISHHGVQGQKWGVKNGPPYPLYRQDPIKYKAIKRLQKAAKTKKDVDTIVNSLSPSDKKRLGVNKNGEYLSLEEGENVMKRILLKDGDTPVAFLDVFDEGTNDKGKTDVSVALAVAGNKHGKGYGGKVAKKGSDWIDKHIDEFGMVWWTTAPDNVASQKLAEKNGWKYSNKDSNKDWKIYRKQ